MLSLLIIYDCKSLWMWLILSLLCAQSTKYVRETVCLVEYYFFLIGLSVSFDALWHHAASLGHSWYCNIYPICGRKRKSVDGDLVICVVCCVGVLEYTTHFKVQGAHTCYFSPALTF